MRKIHITKIYQTFFYTIIFLMISCENVNAPQNSQPPATSDSELETQIQNLGSFVINNKTYETYIAKSSDAAILGFYFQGNDDKVHYYPLYASTYQGLPKVELKIFTSKTKDKIWILSSWPGYETLAYHHLKTGRTLTMFGETDSISTPIPSSLSGNAEPFPTLPSNAVMIENYSFNPEE